jgi:hypothetical protein
MSMHKKGVSSLEFILSFVLFAGFTIAALYFFNPVGNLKNMDYSRDYTINKVISNTSVELNTYSIVIPIGVSDTVISLPDIAPGKNMHAVNYLGERIKSLKEINDFCFDRVKSDERFITLYFSEDIAGIQDLSSCISPPDPSKYQISSSLTERVISENRTLSLNKTYWEDYSSLKTQLGIPNDVDFSFKLEFSATDYISAEKPLSDVTREIFSETNRMEVLRTNGIPQFGQLTVRVW